MTWPIFDDEDHHLAIEAIESSGSDPTAAVVGGAMLEKALEVTLALRFRKHKDIPEKLLKDNGALGNAGPKIDLLYALHLIEKPAHRTLLGLTRIRNFFAHNLGASFESKSEKFQEPLKLLQLHKGLTHYPHAIFKEPSTIPIEPINNNRDLFRTNLKLGLGVLMRVRIDHIPHTMERQTDEAIAEYEREWIERKTKEGKDLHLDQETGDT